MAINADGSNDPVESKETETVNPNLNTTEPVVMDQHPKSRNEREGEEIAKTDK